MTKIMVTGAAGGYGSYAVEYAKQFAGENMEVYGLVRKQADAEQLESKGIKARIGDYTNHDSLLKAFEGIDRVLFVSVSVHDMQKGVPAAAKEAGVKFIAYTSLYGLEHEKFGLEINHRQTEQLISETGIAHAFLRNCWYLEMPASISKAALATGVYPYYAEKGKLSFALKRELAEAGARVITAEDPTKFGETIDLSATPVSYRELGEATAQIANREIEVKLVGKDLFVAELANSGISDLGLMLGNAYQDFAMTEGHNEEKATPSMFEQVLGHKLTPLADALKEAIEKAC